MKLERLVVRCCRHIFMLLTLGICVSAHGAESMHPPVIESGKGLDVLVVGRPIPKLGSKKLVYDRTEWDDEAMPQRVIGVRIYNQVIRAEIDDGKVWRLTISRPGIRTKYGGVGVGDPVKGFAKKIDFEVIIGPGGDLVLIPKHECGLSFLTNMSPDSDGLLATWDSKALAVLPKNIVVRAILVTGCSSTGSAGNENHSHVGWARLCAHAESATPRDAISAPPQRAAR